MLTKKPATRLCCIGLSETLMQLKPPLGIFGGTFDPVHLGHICPVQEAAQETQIENIALMPCYIPSHKNPAVASSQHRLNMLALVCADYPLFHLDPRDIKRGKPTFSLDSLQELRAAMPTTPLCFFIGSDSLQNLCSWHQWQTLFSLCHFVVCERKNESVYNVTENSHTSAQLQELLNNRQTIDPLVLHNSLAGHIYLANTQTVTISSTEIRNKIINNQSVKENLPTKVVDYIHQHKLYQPRTDFC